MPLGRLVVSLEEALTAADELGFPLALKAQSEPAAATNQRPARWRSTFVMAPRLRSAWATMQHRLTVERTDVSLDGMLLERMSEAGIEIIIGARNEGGWGPVIMVGLGGILTELLQDVVFIPAGVGRADRAGAALTQAAQSCSTAIEARRLRMSTPPSPWLKA